MLPILTARQWFAALKVQSRVVSALLLREMLTRFGRHNIGFLWLFVEPMLFTLGVTALWSAFSSTHGSSLPIVAFAVTGYSAVLLWRNMPARCIQAVSPNLALMYHRNVKVIDIFLARLILEAAGATISLVVLCLVFVMIGWMRLPVDLLKVLAAWALLAWFGFALAILLGSLSEASELVEKLWHPASYLTFPLSGAAFLVDIFPPNTRDYLLLVPMVNGVEMLRDGFFGDRITAHYDVTYMVACCLALTLLGLIQCRVISRQVTPE